MTRTSLYTSAGTSRTGILSRLLWAVHDFGTTYFSPRAFLCSYPLQYTSGEPTDLREHVSAHVTHFVTFVSSQSSCPTLPVLRRIWFSYEPGMIHEWCMACTVCHYSCTNLASICVSAHTCRTRIRAGSLKFQCQ